MLQGDTNALAEHADKLAQFQQALFNDMRTTFQLLQNQDDSAPLHVGDLPQAFRDQFVGETGKFLLHVFPRDNMWQRDNQEKFITELRTVDPERHRHAGAALRIRGIAQGQLHPGGLVFPGRDRPVWS